MSEAQAFCGNCGSPLEAGDLFCGNCGTKREEKGPPEEAASSPAAPPPTESPAARVDQDSTPAAEAGPASIRPDAASPGSVSVAATSAAAASATPAIGLLRWILLWGAAFALGGYATCGSFGLISGLLGGAVAGAAAGWGLASSEVGTSKIVITGLVAAVLCAPLRLLLRELFFAGLVPILGMAAGGVLLGWAALTVLGDYDSRPGRQTWALVLGGCALGMALTYC